MLFVRRIIFSLKLIVTIDFMYQLWKKKTLKVNLCFFVMRKILIKNVRDKRDDHGVGDKKNDGLGDEMNVGDERFELNVARLPSDPGLIVSIIIMSM